EAAPAAGGAHMVQIGAYSSKPLAEKGWNDVAKLMPGDMFGRTESFEPVNKDGQTLYRTFVGGFGSKADAQAFCDALKGQGHTCMAK
ncbi:MAG TPA: SPOR domain-containing protein, partial [Caulobacteraceae bacterium]|nr:SPOR domain-containing protein [Caulobacteraceae bacterium]